jgi:hypothetical protein
MSLPLPPQRRRRPGGRLALVIVAVAVAASIPFLLAVLLHHPAPGRAPGHSLPSPYQTTGRVPARAPGPLTVSTAGWRAANLDGTLVPVSGQAGPRRGPWPLAAGYADTPAGAVLAAVNIAVRTSGQLGPDIFAATISRQVTGSGATALLAAAYQDYAAAVGQHPPARTGGPAGAADAAARAFRLAAWTTGSATVDVLAGADTGTGSGVIVRLQVRWAGGDWRLVAPPSGTLAAGPAGTDLPSFTPLPGR